MKKGPLLSNNRGKDRDNGKLCFRWGGAREGKDRRTDRGLDRRGWDFWKPPEVRWKSGSHLESLSPQAMRTQVPEDRGEGPVGRGAGLLRQLARVEMQRRRDLDRGLRAHPRPVLTHSGPASSYPPVRLLLLQAESI